MTNLSKKHTIIPLTIEEKEKMRDDIYENLAKRLYEARKLERNDYTQQDIADYLRTVNTHISRIEAKTGNPNFADIKIIADFLGVSLDWLCSKDTPETITPTTPQTPWIDVPPILAFLSILNRYQPIIELGKKSNQPVVKLSFNFNHLFEQKERYIDFFKHYQVIDTLIKGDMECAEEVDLLTSRLLANYNDLNI